MDVCCDFIVPELTPHPALVGPHIRLAERPMPPHIAQRLPEELRALRSYAVTGDALDLLDYEVNGRAPIWRGPTFDDLVTSQLGRPGPWAFVFEWHCDQIDEVFSVDDAAAVLVRLRANLDWEVPRLGFIAYRTR